MKRSERNWGRLDDMKERLSRLEKRQVGRESSRFTLEPGLTKLDPPDFTASIRVGAPALIVVSEQVNPEACHSRRSSIGGVCSAHSS
jgi:hypothetical protein